MRVEVRRGTSWDATAPEMVSGEGYFMQPDESNGRNYDIATDGQRFLLLKQPDGAAQSAAPTSLVVILNWAEELKRVVPTR